MASGDNPLVELIELIAGFFLILLVLAFVALLLALFVAGAGASFVSGGVVGAWKTFRFWMKETLNPT